MTKANLCKARLYDADMVSAKLKEADATRTVFCGARMQEVNLDKAKLHGARFEGATLTNAFFRGARFDEAALRSIALGALEWRRANWDAETRAELERISSEQ